MRNSKRNNAIQEEEGPEGQTDEGSAHQGQQRLLEHSIYGSEQRCSDVTVVSHHCILDQIG